MEFSPSQFDGRRFENIVPRIHGIGSVWRWLLTRKPGYWPDWIPSEPGPPPPKSSDVLRVTFINHSTFLLQVDGLNLLTDPIWSYRTSPFSWIGPRRHRAPGIRFEDLPPIHAVLLSHDHYDHFDLPTLRRLQQTHDPAVITALGNARRLHKIGMRNVVELDWWQSTALPNGARLTAVPAQHFSGRGTLDRNRTLWCGLVLESPSAVLYFAGDTGRGPHFAQIAARFPRIDVSILPIGAYRPEWFMGEVHLAPQEAIEAHRVLGSRIGIACHYGCFPLADDGEREPSEQLQRVLAETDLRGTEFWEMRHGDGRDILVEAASPESRGSLTG
jgi:L-ascorbate metabolism protein UlaG (beta-lactamase superfamily)